MSARFAPRVGLNPLAGRETAAIERFVAAHLGPWPVSPAFIITSPGTNIAPWPLDRKTLRALSAPHSVHPAADPYPSIRLSMRDTAQCFALAAVISLPLSFLIYPLFRAFFP